MQRVSPFRPHQETLTQFLQQKNVVSHLKSEMKSK